MTDERRTTAVELPGDPAGWPATLRDLLRYLRRESPSREAAVERWLEEPDATERDTVEERLEFLERLEIVDASGGPLTPGPRGREFLDTHDEVALYEALAGAVAGFETLLEALAVRPLTDVEFMDLLERAFDAEFESPDPVVPHRKWLQALGLLAREGGVNELTRRGRLLVETDEELTPPRTDAGGRGIADGLDHGASGPSTAAVEDRPGAGAAGRSVAPAGGDEGASGFDDASTVLPFAAELKRRYDHTCAVCGDRRRRAPEEGFSRVYHPMPLAEPHDGPAEPANAVVVCPNHRADFEHGLLRVDPRTLEVEHTYEPELSGRTLSTTDGHAPGAEYLAYHDAVVADF
jgi:hypothetical protein